MAGLAAQQQPAEQQAGQQFGDHDNGRGLVRRAAEAEYQQSQTARRQHRPRNIEGMLGPRRFRQRLQADGDGQQAEWQVDGEQPRPGRDRQDRGGDGRPQRERGRHHQRIMAKAAAEPMPGVDETDQRGVDAHDAGGAQSLQDTGDQQRLERPRQRAEHGRRGEQDQAPDIDALVADDLAERAERQQGGDHGDLVDIDHPDDVGRGRTQVGRDGGQGDIGDCGVQRGHRQRGEDRHRRPAPLLQREVISRRVIGRRKSISHRNNSSAGARNAGREPLCRPDAREPTAFVLHEAYAGVLFPGSATGRGDVSPSRRGAF